MKPILFNSEMVKAILDGRKTQTRRVIKDKCFKIWKMKYNSYTDCFSNQYSNGITVKRPYKRRMRLGVRETHFLYGKWIKNGFSKTGRQKWRFQFLTKEVKYWDNPPSIIQKNSYRKEAWYKRPSIFMPRWACRIILEASGIRVERVQDISEEDVKAEGIDVRNDKSYILFPDLWDKINKKRGYGWSQNLFVWVIEFKKITEAGGNEKMHELRKSDTKRARK